MGPRPRLGAGTRPDTSGVLAEVACHLHSEHGWLGAHVRMPAGSRVGVGGDRDAAWAVRMESAGMLYRRSKGLRHRSAEDKAGRGRSKGDEQLSCGKA